MSKFGIHRFYLLLVAALFRVLRIFSKRVILAILSIFCTISDSQLLNFVYKQNCTRKLRKIQNLKCYETFLLTFNQEQAYIL